MSKLSKKQLENFIKFWNIKFPYDRLWRKKYNIPFGSKDHLSANQIDIYLDLLEDKYINIIGKEFLENKKHRDEYFDKGVIFKEQTEDIISEEEENKLFKNFKIANLTNPVDNEQ